MSQCILKNKLEKNLALRIAHFFVIINRSISESRFVALNDIELHKNISLINGNDLYNFQC